MGKEYKHCSDFKKEIKRNFVRHLRYFFGSENCNNDCTQVTDNQLLCKICVALSSVARLQSLLFAYSTFFALKFSTILTESSRGALLKRSRSLQNL